MLSMRMALGALVLSGCVAALGAWAWHSGRAPDRPGASGECSYCGVVERVREIANAGPRYAVSTVAGGRDEVVVVLLGALSGTHAASVPQKIYETSVRLDDGTLRAVRDGGVPQWKAGDRVKFVKGRVE